MPKLQKIPDKLTFGEYQEWLKQNPDHPKAKEYIKKWGETLEHFKPSLAGLSHIRSESSYLAEQTGLLRAMLDKTEKEDTLNDEISYRYNDSSHILFIRKVEEISINFTDKRGNKNMLYLFEILEECITERGVIKGKFIEVAVPRTEIIQKALKKGVKGADEDWVARTRSNLVNSKIELAGAAEYLIISEFKNEIQGYIYKKRILP